jgi:BirA family biotin operon repressor/biotin-[acetyl-CoA-carboxylase] ligase
MLIEICDSTNARARELGEQGAPHGSWIASREQTAGRGRQGREWTSLTGNLHFSSIARIPDRAHWTWIPLVSAVALMDALAELKLDLSVAIKWPNDLWSRDRKLAGFLCELHSKPEPFVVIGLGLNCRTAPEGAISLSELAARPVEPEEVLPVWRASLSRTLEELTSNGPADLAARWERKSMLRVGDLIEWTVGGELRRGQVSRLGHHGELRVRIDSGQETALYAEEVRHIRPVSTFGA